MDDVAGADDVAGHAVDFFAFVVVAGGVEFNAEGGGEHGGGHVFDEVADVFLGHAIAVVFGDVAILVFDGHGDADAGAEEAVGFIAGGFGEDAEDDLSGDEAADALADGDDFAAGRDDAGDLDEVEFFNAGVAHGEFEGLGAILVAADAFGEEDGFGDGCDPFLRHQRLAPVMRTRHCNVGGSSRKHVG